MSARTDARNAARRKAYARPRSSVHYAVPVVRGHEAVDTGYRPTDETGAALPSEGPGRAILGRTHCRCGATSPILWTNRERRLWHTEHREQLAGVAWT